MVPGKGSRELRSIGCGAATLLLISVCIPPKGNGETVKIVIDKKDIYEE